MDSRKTFDVIADVLQTGNPSGGLPKEYGRSAQESFGAKFHRKKRKNRHSKGPEARCRIAEAVHSQFN